MGKKVPAMPNVDALWHVERQSEWLTRVVTGNVYEEKNNYRRQGSLWTFSFRNGRKEENYDPHHKFF